MEGADDMPEGWVRFNMVRGAEDPDELVTFGVVAGTVEDVRSAAADQGYEQQLERVAPLVSAVGADGLYEVVEDRARAEA